MDNLPAHRHSAACGCYQAAPSAPAVHTPVALPEQHQGARVVHIHQAPPDRTVQRIALGSGIGAGTVAAGVYFGPLLVGVLTAMAVDIALVVVLVAVLVWGGVTVAKTLSGTDNPSRKGR